MRRSEPPKIRKTVPPQTAGSVARPLPVFPGARPPPAIQPIGAAPRAKLPLPAPPPRRASEFPPPPARRLSDVPPPPEQRRRSEVPPPAVTMARTPSKLPPPMTPGVLDRARFAPSQLAASAELLDASTAEVAMGTGQLETLSAELEPTLAGLRVTNAGTPSQIRSLEIRAADAAAPEHTPRHGFDARALLESAPDDDVPFTRNQHSRAHTRRVDSLVHTPRAGVPEEDDDLLATLNDADEVEGISRSKRQVLDGYQHTRRKPDEQPASEELRTQARAPIDADDSALTPLYDSSELPTASMVALDAKDVKAAKREAPPPQASEADLLTSPRLNGRSGDGFFFDDAPDSERTLARDFGPVASPAKSPASSESHVSDRNHSDGRLGSQSVEALAPPSFLNEAARPSSSGMAVNSGDLVRPVSTQPMYTQAVGPSFPPPDPSRSAPGATRILPNSPQHSSSRPPPPHGSQPPEPERARGFESDSASGYPPLRFGGDAPRGYHPAPAPQWGPSPTAPSPVAAVPVLQLPPALPPVSAEREPPRNLRWVALGLILGAGIVLLGYRYLLRPIDPRPIALPRPAPTLTAAPPPSLDPALLPPLNVQPTSIPVVPTAPEPTVVPTASAAPVPSASASAPKGHATWHPPAGGRPSPKPAATTDGPPMPRPLNPDPPPAPPEPMPGQGILDNAL